MKYNDVIEYVDSLPIDKKIDLIDIINNRIREQRRNEIYTNYLEAESDFSQSNLSEESADDLIQRLSSGMR
jgi:hypothetical protein